MSNKKTSVRKMALETLETRQLMASDLSANVHRGTLFIQGGEASDIVQVTIHANETRVSGVRYPIANWSYSSIHVSLGGGSDRFTLNGQNFKNLDSVFITMGHGTSESVYINNTQINRLSVDAQAAFGTGVTLANVQIRDQALLEFGNDTGQDWIAMHSGSNLNRLSTRMGGGSDRISLQNAAVRNADIDMGAGDDLFSIEHRNSLLGSGEVNGGSGRNTFRNPLSARVGARVRGF